VVPVGKVMCAYCGEHYADKDDVTISHGICETCAPVAKVLSDPDAPVVVMEVIDDCEDVANHAAAWEREAARYELLATALVLAEIPVVAMVYGLTVPCSYGYRVTGIEAMRDASSVLPFILITVDGGRVYYGEDDVGSIADVIRRVNE